MCFLKDITIFPVNVEKFSRTAFLQNTFERLLLGFLQKLSKYYQNDFRFKSSHRRCSVKKSVLKKFGKFTGKRMCQRLFFSKVAGLGLFIKKRSWRKCFLVNFLKCLRTLFYRTRPDNCFVVFLRNLFKGKKFSFQTDPIYLITKFTSVIFIFTQVCKKKYS